MERSMLVSAGVAARDLLGRVATSRSGRDAGSVYVVVRVESATVVFVADGRVRSVSRPKRKNVKHLEFGAPSAGLAERLAAGQPPSDEEIRAAIAAATATG
jgi:large subunit ribosomal protein L14e